MRMNCPLLENRVVSARFANTPLLREIHTLILMKGLIKIYIVKSITTLINISGLNNTEV